MVDKLPSNNDNNKTKYLIVRQNQHVVNRLYNNLHGQSGFHFLIFCLKDFRLSQFLIVSGTSVYIFGYGLGTSQDWDFYFEERFVSYSRSYIKRFVWTTCIIQLVWLCKIVNSYKFDAQIFVLYNFSKIGWVLFLPTCMKKMRPITFEVSECWIILKKLLD